MTTDRITGDEVLAIREIPITVPIIKQMCTTLRLAIGWKEVFDLRYSAKAGEDSELACFLSPGLMREVRQAWDKLLEPGIHSHWHMCEFSKWIISRRDAGESFAPDIDAVPELTGYCLGMAGVIEGAERERAEVMKKLNASIGKDDGAKTQDADGDVQMDDAGEKANEEGAKEGDKTEEADAKPQEPEISPEEAAKMLSDLSRGLDGIDETSARIPESQ